MPSLYHPSASVLDVEVADTPEKRARGLLGRSYLNPHTGMLFVFEKPGLYSFSMRGMHISLDLILLDARWQVVGLMGMSKYATGYFRGEIPYKYALEVRAGWIGHYDIRLGDCFSIKVHPFAERGLK